MARFERDAFRRHHIDALPHLCRRRARRPDPLRHGEQHHRPKCVKFRHMTMVFVLRVVFVCLCFLLYIFILYFLSFELYRDLLRRQALLSQALSHMAIR